MIFREKRMGNLFLRGFPFFANKVRNRLNIDEFRVTEGASVWKDGRH